MNEDVKTFQIKLLKLPDFSRINLQEVNGIESLHIDEKNSKLSFSVSEKYADDAAEIVQGLVSRIRRAGGEVLSRHATYPVLNMTCASCASSTQKHFCRTFPVFGSFRKLRKWKGQYRISA